MNCTECGTKCVKVSATECECPSCCNSFVKRGRRWVAADAFHGDAADQFAGCLVEPLPDFCR
jgi:hypothetical protein